MDRFEIFATAPPGLEQTLLEEIQQAGFAEPQAQPGGVAFMGQWPDVWRANLVLRGAGQILARFAEFRALHLAQLDKRARKVDWTALLAPGTPFRVEATCRSSRIYHDRAARARIERAVSETLAAPLDPNASLRILLRIEDDMARLSVDTSGAPLHRRGHKEAVGKAPMRETLAAMFLRQMGYHGTEPVLDPMCGSGTFVLEAAEIALGLQPGRGRSFAFQTFANFEPDTFDALKSQPAVSSALRFYGSDRDDGAIRGAAENAKRAGLDAHCHFTRAPIAALERPAGSPGLVMVNPPYGARIGNRKLLFALYGTLGAVLKERFGGWRVGMVTSDGGLAKATGLPLKQPGPPIAHGGLRIKLYQTDPL